MAFNLFVITQLSWRFQMGFITPKKKRGTKRTTAQLAGFRKLELYGLVNLIAGVSTLEFEEDLDVR